MPVFIALLWLNEGCGPKRNRDRGAEKPVKSTTAESTAAESTAAESTAAESTVPTLHAIHFFLETSASMGGYLKGGTEFKDVVADLVTKANQIKPVTIYTIAEKPQPISGDVNTFVSELATTKLATGRSSELHRIFRQAGETAKGGDVAILVSDCILSFPDADIRRDPEVNRNNASSTLKNNIYDQFAQFKKAGIGATVLAYTSAFNGTYYTYPNKPQKLTGEKRPFYVWIMGRQELLNQVNSQLADLLSTKPQKRLDFGSQTPLKTYDLFFSLNKKGDWRADKAGLKDLRLKRGQSAEFAIGLDLSHLPDYAQTPEFLRKNLIVSAGDAQVKLLNAQRKADVAAADRLKGREQALFNKDTHVLTFAVSNLFADAADVSVKLPVRFDDWYTDGKWSTLDDRTPDGRQAKTFALQYLMTGVREAYQSSTNDFLALTLKLEK